VERRKVRSKGLPATQAFDLAEERQPARHVGVGEPRQEEPPEQTGQYAHWYEEAGSAAHPVRTIERYAAAWHDHMHMRMVAPTLTIP
jgi:hypothetical protein